MPTTDSSSDPSPPPSHDEVSNTTVDNDSNSEPDHVRAEQQRKRAYLSLLPPDQIIELCLSFEQHVPLPIRTEIWPDDLEAEIVKLQHNTQRTSVEPIAPPAVSTSDSIVQPTDLALPTAPSQQVHPPGLSSIDLPIQPLDSSFPIASSEKYTDAISDTSDAKTATDEPRNTIDERSGELSQSATREENSSNEPQLSETVATSDSQNTQTPAAISATDKEDVAVSSPKPILAPFASTSATPQPAAVPPPYPYAPYGYPLPPGYPPPPGTAQAAYPHTPYYPPPGSVPGYPAHYPGYPPYPPPPGYSTHQPPPPPPPVSGEDLPSYEDMIVEALLDIGEPDGAAPKDLFLWMGARWPLQTNFRPSASQALQKAYRRGRLEKRSGGRYRLNPNWEGGATSKRTTRRPQTLAQTTYAMHQSTSAQTPPSSSPFTTAPLPQRAHISPPPHHTAQQQPYGAYAYPYGAYAGYPGYATFSARPPAKTAPSASTSSTATKTAPAAAKTATKAVSSTDSGKGKDSSSTEEGSDAWVAAQHILKAINFGSLQENSTSTSGTVATSTSTSPAAGSSQAIPPPIMASLGIDVHAGPEDDGLGRATLTDDERASLQAQLALLAAQLSEIAAEEDAEDEDAIGEIDEEVIEVSSPQNQPAEAPLPVVAPASSVDQDSGTSTVLDINQFPDDAELNVIVPEALPAPAAPVEPEAAAPSPHPSERLAAPPPMGSLAPPDGPEKLVLSSAGVPPTTSASTVESEDESDDDDMEMVDVDSYMRSEGIRT